MPLPVVEERDTSPCIYSSRLFHPCILVPEVEDGSRRECGKLFEWINLIGKHTLAASSSSQTSLLLDDYFVPVTAFNRPIGHEYIGSIREPVVFAMELDSMERPNNVGNVKCGYLAQIVKLAGYRAIFTWLPSKVHTLEQIKDSFPFKFSENIASARVCDLSDLKEVLTLHPPHSLLLRTVVDSGKGTGKELMELFMDRKHAVKTLPGINLLKQCISRQSNLRIGQRVELLWFDNPRFVRPSRIVNIVGRRIRLQVDPNESNELIANDHQEGDTDRQFGPSCVFWVDEASFYLVHVGWAILNDYTLVASREYTNHARNIAEALRADEVPPYAEHDVTRWQLTQCKEQFIRRLVNSNQWEVGMKCEILDPLNGILTVLSVATLNRRLEDGYLEFVLDSEDDSSDTLTLHCTSPRLFPPGYSRRHGVPLSLDDHDSNVKFQWNLVPEEDWAPEELFIPDEPHKSAKFKVGAYLEVFSLKEHQMCHPGKIVAVHGRLIRVQFVGWESNDENDELYHIHSRDIVPVGWCEMHGFRLEQGERKEM